METLGDCGGIDEIAGTQLAGDVLVDALHLYHVLHPRKKALWLNFHFFNRYTEKIA